MISKVTVKRTGPETTEFVKGRRYEYNLQNRLAEIFDFGTDDLPNTADDVLLTEYSYDTAGIRTAKIDYEASPAQLTTCLIDPFNLTGYAQVLEETAFEDDGQSGWAPLSRIYYTIGDDVLAQTTSTYSGGWSAGNTKYLLYDGHGSTRQLAAADQSIRQNYNYDAYGTLLQDSAAESNPGITPQQDTSLLYVGEQFDTDAQQYYLRARYYNPTNGLFNRVDPYSGNTYDPQSLHKYLYVHNNPVNGIDPSGNMFFSLAGFAVSNFIGSTLQTEYSMAVYKVGTWAMEKLLAAYTNYGIANRIKEHDNATIIVHGVTPRGVGWSDDFTGRMRERTSNQDYYEFTWSGFGLNALAGINMIAHRVALASLIRAIKTIQQKRYKKVNIVSHSWGTALSRDALYAGVGTIDTWVTMGSPLPASIERPQNLNRWINIYSLEDKVVTLAPWGIEATGFDAISGPGLYNKKGGIRQVRISGGHGAYWVDGTSLDTIGDRLRTQ